MQFKFSTAKKAGEIDDIAQLENPQISWQIARHYIAELLNEHKGDLDETLAAYHEGENGRRKAHERAEKNHDAANWEDYLEHGAKKYIQDVERSYNSGPVVLLTPPEQENSHDDFTEELIRANISH